MNITTGEIRESIEKDPKPGEILISEVERKYLEMFSPLDRVPLLHEMRSKNHNAKRRARKRMEKESKRRNRK